MPVYNSIEDWSAADLTTDSAPSPISGSPISPSFTGFSFSGSGADDWAAWDKIEQSPESDFFLKSELLDSPDLSSIPTVSPVLDTMDVGAGACNDVVFGCEGVNDTRPLFQNTAAATNNTPQFNLNTTMSPRGAPQPMMAMPTKQSLTSGLPTPPEPTSSKERRYPARATNSLKRKSSDPCDGASHSSSSSSSPRSSCSPPPPQRRHTTHAHTSASASSRDSTATSTGAAKPAAGAAAAPPQGPKKTAHNMIEKRYRTNLNDKIAALRDSVPALRVMVHRLENHAGGEHQNSTEDILDEIKAEAGLEPGDDMDVLNGVTPAHKLNKATILSKATEYIAHLERKNRSLAKENASLRNRVEGFEMLVMSRGGQRTVWN